MINPLPITNFFPLADFSALAFFLFFFFFWIELLLTDQSSLDLASEFFHNFFAYDFGGEESRPSELQAIVEGRIGRDWEGIQHHHRAIPSLPTYL